MPGDNSQLDSQLHTLVTTVTAIAQEQQGDCNGLLMSLLDFRKFTSANSKQMFEPSLPNTRKDLYGVLRISRKPGNGAILERMKLQMLMEKLLASEVGNAADSAAKSDEREK
ncbi:MAG UNVERIFIED_CONTAM: hypothetical protein LVR29_04845 [Microcystis novacekii LVE1205-3]